MDYSDVTKNKRKRRQKPYTARMKNTIAIMVFRVVFAVILIAGLGVTGAAIGIYLGILSESPEIPVTDIRPGTSTSFILEGRTGREIARLSGNENRVFVTIDQMPQHLKDAFVAIEDERFFSHNGVDFRSMVRALRTNLTSDNTEGASTITQQLIKNKLGLHRNDLISKLQEQYTAIQFERNLIELHGSREAAKEYILEAYLNMINLGRTWHGVQVAAWGYFGKDVSELTLSESAVIASITRNPSRYLPDRFPEHNRVRQLAVLEKMLDLEMITPWEFMEAVNDPVHERVQSGRSRIEEIAHGVTHSYFVDALIEQVVGDLMETLSITEQQAFGMVYGGGLRIYSTLDQRIQDIIDNTFLDDGMFPAADFEIVVEYHLSARNEITNRITHHPPQRGSVRNRDQVQPWIATVRDELLTANDIIISERYIETPQPQAAFVILDHHNGHVMAIAGGRGDKVGNRNFCRATVATRSPGSQFKVTAAFLPGIDMGTLTAATHFNDAPWTFSDGHTIYTPGNWWSGFRGPMSVRRAIYQSANIVSAKAFQEVGPENAFRYLLNLGFTTLEGTLADGRHFRDTNPATPLGGLTLGVTQLELAAAYAVMANQGQYNRPVFYTRVLGPDGRVILENTNNPVQVISPPAAYILTNMMIDTMHAPGATGHRTAFRNLRMPISGKTGTSQREEDLGFTGFTPYFTAAVWLGHDRPRTLGTGNIHLDMWREIMQQVHIELELPFREFSRPDGVINGSICRVSGLSPSDLCRRAGTVVSDLFVVGTIPSEHCTQHAISWICSLGGVPATEFCPRDFWIEGVASASGECPYHPPFDFGGLPSFTDGSFWGFPDTNLPAGPALPAFPDLDGTWNFDALPTPAPEPMPPAEGDIIQQPLPPAEDNIIQQPLPPDWPSDEAELMPPPATEPEFIPPPAAEPELPPVEEFPAGDFNFEQQITETEDIMPNWFS